MKGALADRAAHLLRGLLQPTALILLYHRVAELSSDPWALAVTPSHFRAHLEIIRRAYQPISLQHLIAGFKRGAIPARAVVVTFDDGYADSLYHALPLLQEYGVPATFFLTSGMLGSKREYWWDELDRLLLQPGTLPAELRISIDGRLQRWQLGESRYFRADDTERYRAWYANQPPPTARHELYRTLWQRLHTLSSIAREQALDDLRTWAGVDSSGRSTHRALTQEEARSLARADLVEIGAHTHTHPSLATLPSNEQRAEIQQSKAYLEALLGQPVTSFAYPYGKQHDYTAETAALVQAAGFNSACVNIAGAVRCTTVRYCLPRVYVQDQDAHTFAAMVAHRFRLFQGARR